MNFLENIYNSAQKKRKQLQDAASSLGGSVVHDAAAIAHPVNHAVGNVQHAPVNAKDENYLNARIAADGAAAFNKAHPGQTYTPGQNGETYHNGYDKSRYEQLMTAGAGTQLSAMYYQQAMQKKMQLPSINGTSQPRFNLGGSLLRTIHQPVVPMVPRTRPIQQQSYNMQLPGPDTEMTLQAPVMAPFHSGRVTRGIQDAYIQ